MLETFLALLAAHVVADFVLQTDWVVAQKAKRWGMVLHIGSLTAVTIVALGGTPWPVLALVLGSHLLMDLIKTFLLKDTFRNFTLDQAVHLAAIILAASLMPDAVSAGFWGRLPADQQNGYFSLLAGITAVALAVPAGGIVIGKAMAGYVGFGGTDGLPKAGQYIGWIERGLILLFILIGQPEGVGLLLAAKSILRFSDVNQTHIRAHTEYVILGTLLSFAWALGVAVAAQAAFRHWG